VLTSNTVGVPGGVGAKPTMNTLLGAIKGTNRKQAVFFQRAKETPKLNHIPCGEDWEGIPMPSMIAVQKAQSAKHW